MAARLSRSDLTCFLLLAVAVVSTLVGVAIDKATMKLIPAASTGNGVEA